MGNVITTGRPAKARNRAAGEHLRLALRILGKTWRKNTKDPDHVLNWKAWIALGLPRSATTIDADIRLGVPLERLAAYAQCLGLPQRHFGSPQTDIRALLALSGQTRAAWDHAPTPDFGAVFQDEYRAYNAPHYIDRLFALIGGVYRVHYGLSHSNHIHNCAFWLHTQEEHRILGRGFFVIFGLENRFTSITYRWHNNLHTHYLCDNHKEFGHIILPDPLRHNLIARRAPFWLSGNGVTDSGLADNAPTTVALRMEKRPAAEQAACEALWERECAAVRKRPSTSRDEADFAVLHDVLAPQTAD